MTMEVPKKDGETLGEIRERVSRLTKRRVPEWWMERFSDDTKVKEGTPLAKEPEEDGNS